MQSLNRAQLQEIDRRSAAEYHLPTIVLMENAARGVADVAAGMIAVPGAAVLILCGGGNNGGDGLAAARHLRNRGFDISIGLIVDPLRYKGDALIQWQIVKAMQLSTVAFKPERLFEEPPLLIIDAMFGTGLTEAPRDPFADIADVINDSGIPILAVDVPSGLDCDRGEPTGACVRASRTVTFAASKVGFDNPMAAEFTGDVVVADIGCPVELIAKIGGKV